MYLAPVTKNWSTARPNANQYFGRSIQDRVEKSQLISQWLTECETNHSSTCEALIQCNTNAVELDLIDNHTNCITVGSTSDRYIALSYVWGGDPIFQLQSGNIEHLKRPGGLAEYWQQIPASIRDAINFAALLQERFVWIDSLCIIQDDESEKARLIPQMDRIFSCALLVVVAMIGQSADAGFLSHNYIEHRISSDLCLVPISSYDSIEDHDGWYLERRAWT